MGYKAEILRFPDQRFSVLAQCNLGSINPTALAQQAAEVYLGDKMGPKPERTVAAAPRRNLLVEQMGAPAVDLSAFAGSYHSDEVDATYRLSLDNGRLLLNGHHIPAELLVPAGPDTFRAGPLTLHFERSTPGGLASSFTVEAGRVRNIRFVRQ
jgi:hypothetical protein